MGIFKISASQTIAHAPPLTRAWYRDEPRVNDEH